MMVILLLRDMKGEERAVPMSGEDLSLSRHWRAISVNNYYYSKRVVVEVVEWEGKKKMVRRRHKVTTTFSPTHRCRRHREKKERKKEKKNSSFSAESRWRESAASRTNERYANWFDVWRKGKRERERKKNWSRVLKCVSWREKRRLIWPQCKRYRTLSPGAFSRPGLSLSF